MATIVSTELKVYTGTTTSGTQVGNTITDSTSGGPASVNLNNTTLGAWLSPGEQYCVIARCTNDESYTTAWTEPPTAFKTLISADITSMVPIPGTFDISVDLDYNDQVLSVTECGVYVSTSSTGTNAQRIVCTGGAQSIGQDWEIPGLSEHTTYYVIPFVVDNETTPREYKPAWSEAERNTTGYNAPTVTLLNPITTTYNSISGSFTVSTNDTLSSVYVTIAGGGSTYRINKTATTGIQTFSITDGDTDDSTPQQRVTISPNTPYTITVTAVNTSGGTGTATDHVETPPQSTETIRISSVDVTSPTTATVNLLYN